MNKRITYLIVFISPFVLFAPENLYRQINFLGFANIAILSMA